MSRNQKATILTSGMYALALVMLGWGCVIPQDTRIAGLANNKRVDIPVWLQDQYPPIEKAKVKQGWGGARLLVWGIGLTAGVIGVTLSNERRAELERERVAYEIESEEAEAQRRTDMAYNVSIKRAMLQRTGEARMALHEDSLLDELDTIRQANGWFAPPVLKAPIAPVIAPAGTGPASIDAMKTPAEYAAEIEAAKAGAVDRLETSGANTERVKYFQDRGESIMASLATLRMSILNAAPTGAGKTHTLNRWLGDYMRLFPRGEAYVIARKNDSFLGLREARRVSLFDSFSPEVALINLDTVYSEMQKRLKSSESQRRQYDDRPLRLILDDWYSTYIALRLDSGLWTQVRTKLSDIVTLGREVNVCLFICTQSYILESLGLVEDSNIRSNLAIICQGFVKITDGRKQGDFSVLQGIIKNNYIVPAKEDKERLSTEMREIIELSKREQVPALFSAIDEPTLALAPRIQIAATMVADRPAEDFYSQPKEAIDTPTFIDPNEEKTRLEDEKIARELRELRARFEEEEPSDDLVNQSPGSAQDDDSKGVTGDDEVVNQSDIGYSGEEWVKWLPSPDAIIKLLEDTDAKMYSFSNIVRSKLKKTDGEYNRKTKFLIVQLLLDRSRLDLIEKYEIDPKKYLPE